jgi:hypothetical protein
MPALGSAVSFLRSCFPHSFWLPGFQIFAFLFYCILLERLHLLSREEDPASEKEFILTQMDAEARNLRIE